jgi:hypothetical protein
MQRYLLIVLGMHRSGTSALTGAFVKSGAYPGAAIMPATADNPEGYWECAPVVQLNEALLKRMGSRWDSVAPLPAGWMAQPGVEALREEAAKIIATQFGDSKWAVLKDPRLCRVLPFWRDAFTAAGFTLGCALMVRRPMEVAASLARRDQFAPEKSLALWYAHLIDAERDSRGLPRATISYDALLADASGTLARVCEDAAFPLKPSAAQKRAAADLVQPDLKRQHHETPKRAARESLASGLDTALESGYAKLADLPPGKDPQAAVTALSAAARPALALAMPPWFAQELEVAQAAARQRADEVDAARRNMAELQGHIEAARKSHKARDEIEAALRARSDDLALTRTDLAAVRESLRAEIASMGSSGIGVVERELRDTIARLQQELSDERTTIARLTEQIDQARYAAQNYEQQILQAREHIDTLVGQIEVARQAHATRDAQDAEMQENLDATHQELSVLGAEFNSMRLERDEMAVKLEQLSPEADGLRRDLAIRTNERDALAATAKQTGEAVSAMSAELTRRAAVEQELTADRARLAQFEREARERIALLERQLAELNGEMRPLRERLDVANAELARLDTRWLGRMARRLARGHRP